jgi:endonuclease/exonuclease/phosphatase (EEP) superfamily protein YafD
MKQSNKIILFCFIILFFLSVVRYIHDLGYWLVDIISNFPLQYALMALALMSICIWKKIFRLAILSGLLFVFNISTICDLGDSIHAVGHAGTTFKIYSANINKDNRELSSLNLELQEIDPDIVLLLEVEPKHNEQLRPIMLTYPYRIENVSDGILGFVFLCKFPVHDHHFTKLSEHGNSLLEARLEINQKSVMFYGIHAQRPRLGNYNERISQLLWLARQIKVHSLPVIVAGDLNTTPFTPIFRDLMKIARLKDSREGFGWQPSWPTYFPFLWLPIDHVLVSPEIQVYSRITGSFIGSDHFPVVAELSLNRGL